MIPILIVEVVPDGPYGGGTHAASGYRRAESADGKWWLTRQKGLVGWLRGWDWRPVNGQFVTLQLTKEVP